MEGDGAEVGITGNVESADKQEEEMKSASYSYTEAPPADPGAALSSLWFFAKMHFGGKKIIMSCILICNVLNTYLHQVPLSPSVNISMIPFLIAD